MWTKIIDCYISTHKILKISAHLGRKMFFESKVEFTIF